MTYVAAPISGKDSKKTSKSLASRLTLGRAISGVALGLLAGSAASAMAASQYWDTNNTTAGAGATPTGTWNDTNTNWSTNSGGTVATGAWVPGNTAVFSAGTDATKAFTVTVSGTQSIAGITFEEGTATLSGGTLSLSGTTPTINYAGTVNPVINSNITGAGGVKKIGTGIVIFGGSGSNYTGQTLIMNGGITINKASALGATGAGNEVTFDTANANWTPQLLLSGGITVPAGKDIIIHNGGQSASSQGQLYNSSGTNTWAGNVTMQGTVSGTGQGLASIGAASGTTLVVTGGVATSSALGGGWFAKTGLGTVALAHDNSSGTGWGATSTVRVFAGILEARADGAFGPASVPGEVDGVILQNNSTSTIAFNGGIDYGANGVYKELIVRAIGGTQAAGATGYAEVDNTGGNNIFRGDILADGQGGAAEMSLGAKTGSLELRGKLYISGTSAQPMTIYKTGPGTVLLTGNNDGTDGVTSSTTANWRQWAPSGTFQVNQGELKITGDGVLKGSSSGPMNIQANAGGTFTIDNSTVNNPSRLAANATITLSGGELKYIGNVSDATPGSIGNVSVSGDGILTVMQPTGATVPTTVNAGSLSRSGASSILLRGMDGTNTKLYMSADTYGYGGSEPTQTKIVPWAFGNTSATAVAPNIDYITIATDGQARPLVSSEYESTLTDGEGNPPSGLDDSAAHNVWLSSSITTPLKGDPDYKTTIINALKITGDSVSVPQDTTVNPWLDINSGGILSLATGNNSISGGTLYFGLGDSSGSPAPADAQGFVYVANGQLTISSTILGQMGLVKAGTGTLVLGSAANNYSGGTTISGGQLIVASEAALGAAASPGGTAYPVTLNGGSLEVQTTAGTTDRQFVVNAPTGNALIIDQDLTITSAVTGNGIFTKGGTATMVLTNTGNAWKGGTAILGGTLKVSTATLPAGGVTNNGVLFFQQDTDGAFASAIGGSGSVIKDGTGALTLGTTANSWTGVANELRGGTLILPSGGANLGNSPATLAPAYLKVSGNSTIRTGQTGVASTFMSATKGVTIVDSLTIDIPSATGAYYNPEIWLSPIAGTPGNTTTVIKTGPGWLGFGIATANPSSYTKLVVKQGMFASRTPSKETDFGATPGTFMADQITLDGGWITTTDPLNLTANRGIQLGASAANGGIDLSYGTMTIAGVISDQPDVTAGGLVVGTYNPTTTGGAAAKVILTGNNTYTGGTTIARRTLQIGNNGTSGSILGSIAANNGALILSRSDTFTFGNAITAGTGTLTMAGSGTTVVTGNNSGYTGATTVSNGVLLFNSGTAFPTGSANVTVSGSGAIASGYGVTDAGFLGHIATTSTGALALTTADSAATLDFTSGTLATLKTMSVGAAARDGVDTVTYTGTLTPDATAGYLLGGGNGTLVYAPAINSAGKVTIEGKVAFNSAQTYSGSTTVSAGSLKLGGTLKTGSVVAAAPATLDLAGNRLVLTGLASDPSSFVASLKAKGVVDTTATSSVTQAVGWAKYSDLYGAAASGWGTVAPTDYVAKLSLMGDTNLDGLLNQDDYARMDRALALHLAAGTARWMDGDVNYDGAVTLADYTLVDAAFIQLRPASAPSLLAERQAEFGSEYVAGVMAAVPEPTSLGLVGLVGLGLLGKRRRRA